jgi:small subunit ribosomal protein S4
LEEKQKLRLNYGVTEKQMLRYVRKARRASGSTGLVMLQILEMRLDNTVFRMGMAPTIPAARQLVNHGHIMINGKVVDIASYQCRPGEVITVRDRAGSKQLVEANLQYPGLANLPNHLEFDKKTLTGKVNGVIEREWIALQVNELLIVEYYSRQA